MVVHTRSLPFRKQSVAAVAFLTLAGLTTSCGQGDVTRFVCDPGEAEECSCDSEQPSGTRICDGEGIGWGPCECGDGDPVCLPGAEEGCLCDDTSSGIRSCDSDGAGFGECHCEGSVGDCLPPAQEECACGDGRSGLRICEEPGEWRECECEPDDEDPPPPPTWDCSGFDCAAASTTTTLGRMNALNGCDFELALQEPLESGQTLADALLRRLEDEGLGSRRSLSTVVGNLNRDGLAGISDDSLQRLSGLQPTGFRWNAGDDAVTYWYPQGITGTSDSRESGLFDGRRLIVVSWYHKTADRPTRGARISIADITDQSSVTYRHLLLVEPFQTPTGPDFGPAEYDSGGALHVGGIAWYGQYLYVADTVQGLRVYDMDRIFRPTNTDDTSRIGISSGRSDAHGYLFAVPRVGRYRLTSDSCRIRFAFVGLNRLSTPPVLITGEYFADHQNGRLAAWPLDPQTHLLETRGDTTRADQAVVVGQTRAQGALWIGSSFFVSSSSQDGSYGRLYKNRPGAQSTSVNWVHGAEDLYWERSQDLIWTPAEHPGRRDVAAVRVF